MKTDREYIKELMQRCVQRINIRYAFLEADKLKEQKPQLNQISYSSPNPEMLTDLLELLPNGEIKGDTIIFKLPEFGSTVIQKAINEKMASLTDCELKKLIKISHDQEAT